MKNNTANINPSSDFIVGYELLKILTGYDLPSKQAQCLRAHNIFYMEGKNGQITTTRNWLDNAAKDQTKPKSQLNLDF